MPQPRARRGAPSWCWLGLGLAGCHLILGADDLTYDLGSEGVAGGTAQVGTLALGEHEAGQATDKLIVGAVQGVELFAYSLIPAQEDASIEALAFTLSGVAGIASEDLANVALWRDDGTTLTRRDDADTMLAPATVAISGDAGTITVADGFVASEEASYLLVADVSAIAIGDGLTIGLLPGGVTARGALSGAPIAATGSVSDATHAALSGELLPGDVSVFYATGSELLGLLWTAADQSWTSAGQIATGQTALWVAAPPLVADPPHPLGTLQTGLLEVYAASGDGVAADFPITTTVPVSTRGFDVAIEGISNEALLVYSDASANPQYMVRSGASWSSADAVLPFPPSVSVVEWVELVSKPGSDEIALFYSESSGALFAVIWDGMAWETQASPLETALRTRAHQNFAGAYDGNGALVSAWGWNGGTRAAIRAGGQFGPAVSVGPLKPAGPIRLASQPGGNLVALAQLEYACGGGFCDDFEVAMWNGFAWVDGAALDANIGTTYGMRPGSSPIDVAWAGTTAVAAYGWRDMMQTGLRFATWTPPGPWILAPAVVPANPLLAAETVNVQALSLPDQSVMFVLGTDLGDLWAKRYANASWTDTEMGIPLGQGLLGTGVPFAAVTRQP